jgi:alanyl-tRNA synthetase
VLRKIMRRAMRHGKKLGFTEPVLHALVDVVVSEMGPAYPELVTNRDAIVRTVRSEEERFDTVLTSGLPKLEEIIDRAIAAGSKTVPGDEVFKLYDSLGVPFDFAEDLAEQRGLTVDRAAYDRAMDGQRERARAGSAFETKKAQGFELTDAGGRAAVEALRDKFDGYATTEIADAAIVALCDESRRSVASLEMGQEGFVILDRTPFYVESGGQVSDTGTLARGIDVYARVTGMARVSPGGPRAHRVHVEKGTLKAGMRVLAEVDADTRDATRRNHTATHLLHAALRQVLGTHVRQAGSLVAPNRLRFDFSHFAPLTPQEHHEVERIVNRHVYENLDVTTDVRNTEDAIKAGAMALFGEKYGETVRVVSVPGVSTELCGGTHVRATGDIGLFAITEEAGVAAGVRRIEAVTGADAVDRYQAQHDTLQRALQVLGVPAEHAIDAIARLQAEGKRLARENEQLKLKVALGGGGRGGEDVDVVSVGDAKFIARRVTGLDKGALRGLSDSLRDRLARGVVVLAADHDGKVSLLVSVTKDLTDKVKAGALVKTLAPIVGGGGGGRPDFAEDGGKDASKIDDLLAKAREMLSAQLG